MSDDDLKEACKMPGGTFDIQATMTNCGWYGTDEFIGGEGSWVAETNGKDHEDDMVMVTCRGPHFGMCNIGRTRDEVERMHRGDEELVTKLVEEANGPSSSSKLVDIFVTNVSKGSEF